MLNIALAWNFRKCRCIHQYYNEPEWKEWKTAFFKWTKRWQAVATERPLLSFDCMYLLNLLVHHHVLSSNSPFLSPVFSSVHHLWIHRTVWGSVGFISLIMSGSDYCLAQMQMTTVFLYRVRVKSLNIQGFFFFLVLFSTL